MLLAILKVILLFAVIIIPAFGPFKRKHPVNLNRERKGYVIVVNQQGELEEVKEESL